MKFEGINGPPGEFASKALYRRASVGSMPAGATCKGGWELSTVYFFSIEEARATIGSGCDVKWPVEMYDNSLVYVPDPEEMK